MLKGSLDDSEIDIPCAKCGYQNRKRVVWLRHKSRLACGGCGIVMTLENDEFRSGLDEVENSILELRRALREISKKR